MGAPDDGAIPGRDRRRIAVSRIAGNGGDQDCRGDSAARAQQIRLGVCHWASASRAANGDDRALWARGDSTRQRAARGAIPRACILECAGDGESRSRECPAVVQLTAVWALSALGRWAPLWPALQ